MAEELKVTEMCEKFFMELSKSSKHTATGTRSPSVTSCVFFSKEIDISSQHKEYTAKTVQVLLICLASLL